jgi:heme/copper-type cytochrome/quinol oxidase subunit 2
MNRGQRFTFLAIAVVIAIVAVIVLADSSEDDTDSGQTSATATATPAPPEASPGTEETPTATPTPTPTPKPQPPLLTGGKVTELEFTEGDTVRFRVRSDTPDHVHVHGYDLMKDVVPGKTTTMSFKATITGIFEIEFEDAGEQIGELRVDQN